MLTNLYVYVFCDAFHILLFYCPHFQGISSFNKIVINKFFNTTLKPTGAYILSLKATKSK